MTDPFLALNGNLLKDIQTERRTNTLFTTARQIYFLDSHTHKNRALRSTENLVNKLANPSVVEITFENFPSPSPSVY